MLKTIKQIADELGISKQAVAKRVATLPPTEVTTDNRGVKRVTLEGQAILRGATTNHQPTDNQPKLAVDILVELLQKELEIKNQQIEALTVALENTSTALSAAQALHAGTMRKQLGDGNGRGFISRLFGKKRSNLDV